MSTWSILAGVVVSVGVSSGCGGVTRVDEDGGAGTDTDASAVDASGEVDAGPEEDAGPVEVTLAQSISTSVTDGLRCGQLDTQYIAETSFYRAFVLSEFDVTAPFHVGKVTFGIYMAEAGGEATSQAAEIRIHDYKGKPGGGVLEFEKFHLVGSAAFDQPDVMTPTTVDVPVSVELGSDVETVVVEIFVPSGISQMNKFFVGANVQGERAPAYYRGPTCGRPTPISLPNAGFARDDYVIVLSVTGETR